MRKTPALTAGVATVLIALVGQGSPTMAPAASAAETGQTVHRPSWRHVGDRYVQRPDQPDPVLPGRGTHAGQSPLNTKLSGVTVAHPTTIHATGAELSWSAYQEPSPDEASDSPDDIVEYQVHRSRARDFRPSPETLVAPVDADVTKFTDTTAKPADGGDGKPYFYMVAVKLADGSLVPSEPLEVHTPKAGHTARILDESADRGAVDEALPKHARLLGTHAVTQAGDHAAATASGMKVTYVTPAGTYYAPGTPGRIRPGQRVAVIVTVTNTTDSAWDSGEWALSYHWRRPDGDDETTWFNRLDTKLPHDVAPGESVTVQAHVKAPRPDLFDTRTGYILAWDLRSRDGDWLSETADIGPLTRRVVVAEPTSNQLGLEDFYQYSGTSAGSGSSVLVNQYSGNAVFGYNAFSNPNRGLAAFVRLTYNSQDSSAAPLGYGWSLQASSITRVGTPLRFGGLVGDVLGHPSTVTLTDGDGTSHVFRLNRHGSHDPREWSYDSPAGVDLYLQHLDSDNDARAWVFTRPDRTQFFFNEDGYQTAVVDGNGNTLRFVYERGLFHSTLCYVIGPSGRRVLSFDYYNLGDPYRAIRDGEVIERESLANPAIAGRLASIEAVNGRSIRFVYDKYGLLRQATDGAGSPVAKTFGFAYGTDGLFSAPRLQAISDPRGNATELEYFGRGDPHHLRGRLHTLTDRRGGATVFGYADPDGHHGKQRMSTVTNARGSTTTYRIDGYGRPVRVTNAKDQTLKLTWGSDHNVVRAVDPQGAVTTWKYNHKTGYPLRLRDAEANATDTPPTRLHYSVGLDGHIGDLVLKKSPEGRVWTFGYDKYGNLLTVHDPKGNTTPKDGDYTTHYAYDQHGQLVKSTDARGNTTRYGGYGPTGNPGTIVDAYGDETHVTYDAVGDVTSVTDAKGDTSTYTYDVLRRPLRSKVPKDAEKGEYIVTPAPVYDAGGNIVETTAPNGAVTTHTYNAGGQLASTVLPSNGSEESRKVTYSYDEVGNLLTQTQPKGNLTDGHSSDYVTTYAYNKIGELTSVTNAAGDTITYNYDEAGNLTTVIDPKKTESDDPDDFTTKYAYDLNHRVTKVTDAKGKTVSYAYDLDGNKTAITNKAGTTTHLNYTARGLLSKVQVPHKKKDSGGIVTRTTKYRYDQAGNRTKVITPRGVATPSDGADFVHRFVYDKLGRVTAHVFPYDPDSARYDTPHKMTYGYDKLGNRVSVSAPPSAGQKVRNTTKFSYFDNGWIASVTDQWGISSTYDYDPLGQQTKRTLHSAGGSASRTMGWAYYPNGALQARSDDGVPTGLQVVLVDNSNTARTKATGQWAASDAGDDYRGYNYRTHTPGDTGDGDGDDTGGDDTGGDDDDGGGSGDKGDGGGGRAKATFSWKGRIPADGDYEAFVRYPRVPDAATGVEYTVAHKGGKSTKHLDQTTRTGEWVSLGSFAFTKGKAAKITLSGKADGTVVADAVKLVRDNSDSTDEETKDFGYAYDPNGNLVGITDNSSGAKVDRYDVSYTGLNQVHKVEEVAGGSVDTSTTYSYGANGNPTKRVHGDETAAFDYTTRGLPAKVTHTGSGSGPKVTTYAYTARGLKARMVKGNDNTVAFDYFRDGLLRHKVEQTPGGSVVASHAVGYTHNGLRARDAVTKMNADDHSDPVKFVKSYAYTPRDRVGKVTKKSPSGSVLETESYTYDANANVVEQTVDGKTTSYGYNRNRLTSATTGGVTASYSYDPFGRLSRVAGGGQTLESYGYDGFGRVSRHRSLTETGDMSTTRFAYDPLDRTAAKTTDAGGDGAETTEFDYLGLSGRVLSERVAGRVQRSYTYSPWGRRLSQVIRDTGSGGPETSWYGYTPHHDVGTLTGGDGGTRATYGYTAYGRADLEAFTGVDKPAPGRPRQEAYNSYRFNAKRWSATPGGGSGGSGGSGAGGSYDMGFRRYNPGLGRYLERDMYAGALANLNLVSDPLTGSRYAFAGGNPINLIEQDGHKVCFANGYCPSNYTHGHNPTTNLEKKAAQGSTSGSGATESKRTPSPSPAPRSLGPPSGDPPIGMGAVHTALDIFGLAGPFGAVFDVLNCGAYSAQNKKGQAAVSCAAAVPGLGLGAIAGKYGLKYGDEAAAGIKAGSKLAKAGRSAERAVSHELDIPSNLSVRIPGTGKGGYRVPDFAPGATIAKRGSVVEVKNVKRLHATRQLRDLHAFAQSQGVPLEIFTNAQVRGGKLADWIEDESLILTPLPNR